VVLVNLTVNGGLGLLMTVLENLLVHNGGSHILVDCSVIVTCLGPRRRICLVTLHESANA